MKITGTEATSPLMVVDSQSTNIVSLRKEFADLKKSLTDMRRENEKFKNDLKESLGSMIETKIETLLAEEGKNPGHLYNKFLDI